MSPIKIIFKVKFTHKSKDKDMEASLIQGQFAKRGEVWETNLCVISEFIMWVQCNKRK